MCAWGEKVENHWHRVKKNVFISPTSNAIRYIKSKQWRLYPNISVTRETFHFGPCAFHLQSSFLRISPLCPRCCKLPSLTPSSFSCATDTSKLPSRKGVPLIIAMCCNWKVTRLSSISKKKKNCSLKKSTWQHASGELLISWSSKERYQVRADCCLSRSPCPPCPLSQLSWHVIDMSMTKENVYWFLVLFLQCLLFPLWYYPQDGFKYRKRTRLPLVPAYLTNCPGKWRLGHSSHAPVPKRQKWLREPSPPHMRGRRCSP